MGIKTVTVTGSTQAMNSDSISLNIYQNFDSRGIFIFGGTTGVVDLQATPNDTTWVSVTGFTSVSGAVCGELPFPAKAVRIQSRANATGTFTLAIVEPQSA
jgi:hypothetical protein